MPLESRKGKTLVTFLMMTKTPISGSPSPEKRTRRILSNSALEERCPETATPSPRAGKNRAATLQLMTRVRSQVAQEMSARSPQKTPSGNQTHATTWVLRLWPSEEAAVPTLTAVRNPAHQLASSTTSPSRTEWAMQAGTCPASRRTTRA